MDRDLVQIVDAAMAAAVAKGGAWIACKPGCAECCRGPFPIAPSDARRLRAGLAQLRLDDPDRAARVAERARVAVENAGGAFPLDESAEAEARFEALDEDAPCPALDPETGTCDLYTSRPLTCRTFGPAIRWSAGSVGVCELCFVGASDEEIAACEVTLDGPLIGDLEREGPQTLVAFALTATP